MQALNGIDYNVVDRNLDALINGEEPFVNQRTPELGSRVSDTKAMKADQARKSSLPSFGKPKSPNRRTPEYPEGNTGAYPTNVRRGPPRDSYVQRRNGQNSYGDESIESYSTNNPPQRYPKKQTSQTTKPDQYEDYLGQRSERESRVSHRRKPSMEDQPLRSPRGRSAVNQGQNRRDSFKQMQGDPRDRGLSAYIKSPQERFDRQYSQ